ncbi:amino acid-binding protein [Arthrobacter mobilis]|uniref:Amino acid-binding protein n=1 Tax=Arthrobacter mobilis TaxID=2724944 RepID=A0A7X6HCR8_9MICC|nr:amino acid-binding protein [Arthrobacter mobilis]NKX54731.1 amino acid-binding protein [Arthrobacter mobilis]
MRRTPRREAPAELACDGCGQAPEPPKARLTAANIAAMLPIELLVHAAVVQAHLPYVLKVLILTVAATVLAIWVAEPSATKLLRRWLHAPLLKRRRRIEAAPALWRVRTIVQDRPGALERVTHALSCLDANILSIHVHPVADGVLDELVLATPAGLTERELLQALEAGSGRNPRAWRTTPVALADGQTRALGLAARVAGDPAELPHAVATLLRAVHVEEAAGWQPPADGTVLKLPSVRQGVLLFSRPGEPFTPAESARAHRLAELAEAIELRRSAGPATAG